MSLENRKLALIEDDPIMGESMAQRLKLEGATVCWWRSVVEALKGLSEMHPDTVICDIRLPDCTGADVFRTLARERKAPPFLFITGFGEIGEAVGLMREGARDYLTKPFVMSEFLTRLEHVLGPAEPEGDPVLGVSPAMREVERAPRRACSVQPAADRGDRRRQGGLRSLPARAERQAGRSVHGGELRGAAGGPHGERAARP